MQFNQKIRENIWKFIFQLLKSQKKYFFLGTLGCFLFFVSEHYIIPNIIGRTIDFIHKGSSFINSLKYNFIIYIFSWGIGYYAYYLGRLSYSQVTSKIEYIIRNKMFQSMQKIKYEYILNDSEGGMSKAIDIFSDNLMKCFDIILDKVVCQSLVVFVIIITFCLQNKYLGLIVIFWIILHIYISFYFINKLKNKIEEQTYLHQQMTSMCVETFKNKKVSHFFNLYNLFNNNFEDLQEKDRLLHIFFNNYIAKIKVLKGIICLFFQGILVNFFLYKLWVLKIITLGKFISLFNINGAIISLVWQVSEKLPNFLYYLNKSENIMFYLDEDKQESKIDNSVNIPNPKGEIVVKNISFAHDEKEIVNNFSIKFPAKSKTLIMGYSGIGKSTFVDMISGLITGYEGEIFFDSVNIKSLKREAFSDYASLISNNGLIAGSLAYNVSLDNNGDKNKIFRLLVKLNININSVEDVDEIIIASSSNCKFSEGEKQRILIARALYRSHNHLLIADEPFRGLDFTNKMIVKEMILKSSENKTLIVIDHSTLLFENVDQIVFFGLNQNIYFGTAEEMKKIDEFNEFLSSDQ